MFLGDTLIIRRILSMRLNRYSSRSRVKPKKILMIRMIANRGK